MHTRTAISVGLLAATLTQPALAQEEPHIRTNVAVDSAITGGAFALAALASYMKVDTQARWQRELLPFDEAVRENFSANAAGVSDTLAALAVFTPLALQTGQGWNREVGKRALVFTQALAISTLLNSGTKYFIGRPRPYVYGKSDRVQAYARGQALSRDSHLSFYSGHASTTFAAAVAGSYLFTQSTDDTAARTAVWAFTLAVAGTTATLRVRAGKHYYSDVIVGALVGSAVGATVTALHYHGGDPHALSGPEWAAIAAGPFAGVLIGALLPIRADINELLEPGPPTPQATLVPWISPRADGGGLALLRTF